MKYNYDEQNYAQIPSGDILEYLGVGSHNANDTIPNNLPSEFQKNIPNNNPKAPQPIPKEELFGAPPANVPHSPVNPKAPDNNYEDEILIIILMGGDCDCQDSTKQEQAPQIDSTETKDPII